MRLLILIPTTLLSLAGAMPVMAGEASDPTITTHTPTGSYQRIRLTLAKGRDDGNDLNLMLGLRAGKLSSVWYMGSGPLSGCHMTWSEELKAQSTATALSGEFTGQGVMTWNPMKLVGTFTVAFNGQISGASVTGTYTITMKKDEKESQLTGAMQGTVTDEAASKIDALPPGKDWPWYYGIGQTFSGPACGTTFFESLSQARCVWRSEDSLSGMWGRGPEDRYWIRSAFGRSSGGSSSPVISGGMVYQFYYTPHGDIDGTTRDYAVAAPHPKSEAEAIALIKAKVPTAGPSELRHALDWFRPNAIDHIVCMDAATGQTVWKTSLTGRSTNVELHKWRGFNPTPFVSGGMVYVVNYANRCYALDAKTGALKWEYSGVANKVVNGNSTGSVGPVVAEKAGVVAVAGSRDMRGVDAKTGKELWKGPDGSIGLWVSGGQEYFLVGTSLLEAATGKVLWTIPETDLKKVRQPHQVLIENDRLVVIDYAKKEADQHDLIGFEITPQAATKKWSVVCPQPMIDSYSMVIHNGHVYVNGSTQLICVKLTDGTVVSKTASTSGARTQIGFAADGRVFIQPEGRHGKTQFNLYDANPSAVKQFGTEWLPPHYSDTAYAVQPVCYPLVDGRIFVRGQEGLYCYDLRKR